MIRESKLKKAHDLLGRLFGLEEEDDPYAALPDIAGMLSERALQRELARQRALADRAGSYFMFIRFGFDAKQCRGVGTRRLISLMARIICNRARLSDVIGWCGYAREQVGLILPGTTQEGALCMIRGIEQIYREAARFHGFIATPAPEFACEIFTYPSKLRQTSIQTIKRPARRAPAAASGKPGLFLDSELLELLNSGRKKYRI